MRVSVFASPKLIGYVTIGASLLLLGMLLGRPEPAEIGVAFLAAAVIGIVAAEPPRLSLRSRLDRDSVIEGEPVLLELDLISPGPVHWVRVLVPAPPGIEARSPRTVRTVALQKGVSRALQIPLVPSRWGRFRLGSAMFETHDALGFHTFQSQLEPEDVLRVFPREEVLRRAVRPLGTQTHAGDEVARVKGAGMEFAGVRPFEPGDRVRHINWPVTTRLGKVHVNEFHPQRNADMVIFLDSFSDVGDGRDSTLLMAVRAASAVARHYLRRRDRVGLVSFGGILRWQIPAVGVAQGYRILDALLSTESTFTYTWKGLDVIPSRVLPPKALVVAITPLMDQRSVRALLDLRGRGFDLVVVEVSPVPFAGQAAGELEDVARRLWLLNRERTRYRFWQAGVPVATWSGGDAFAPALEEVGRFRRFARMSRVS